MFAQSVVEYGALGSFSSGIQSAAYTVSAWIGTVSPTTWVIAVVALIGLIVFLRR
jgi:hypothetical protein